MARILVIDDDDAVRMTIVRTLKRAEHDILEASDGVQGMTLFRSHKPDLVVTDIFMPTRDGIETIQQIRAEAPNVPVLAISGGVAGAGNNFLRMSGQLGADATLAKPFRAAKLLTTVDSLLATAAETR